MPLPACVYHAVRKTFDLHKEELNQGLHFEKMLTMLKNFITNVNTKYNVYIQVNIDLKIENVTLTKNVSV